VSAPDTPSLIERLKRSLRLTRALRLVWQGSPRLTALSLVLVIFRAALPLAALYLTKLVVDAIAAGAQGADIEFSRILFLLGLTAAVGLMSSLLGVLSGLVTEALAFRVTDRALETIHRKSVAMDLHYYEDAAFHDSLHRAQRDAPSRPQAVLANLLQVIQTALMVVGLIGLLVAIHWLLAVLMLVGVLPALWVRIRHAERYFRWQERTSQLDRQVGYLSWLLLYPSAAKEIRLFGLGDVLAGRYRDLRTRLRRESFGLSRQRSVGDSVAQAVASVVVFVALAFIAWRTFEGELSIGDLVLYFGAVQRGRSAAQTLFASLGNLYEDNLFLATLEEFMAVEPAIVAPADPQPIPRPIQRGIAFEGVSFRYPGSSRPLLEHLDLSIGAGEIVALVGANGAGKTTIVKLLCRLYDPDGGRITIDGVDLRDFRPEELRREISVVFQDFMHYQVSARENIWFGDVSRSAEDADIIQAATMAGADSVLRKLPQGYQTILGNLFQDAEELSVGEWQKVAIARAFFNEAQLLVVDEPTSALDALAEAELFEKLRTLVAGRATLLISHRFSTVRMADRIYVIEGGKVLETGSHDELMLRGGKYASLFRIQAAPYRETETSIAPSPDA